MSQNVTEWAFPSNIDALIRIWGRGVSEREHAVVFAGYRLGPGGRRGGGHGYTAPCWPPCWWAASCRAHAESTPHSPARDHPQSRCIRGEPDLSRNLETFFAQDYDGAVQILFGVHDERDPGDRGGAGAAGQIIPIAIPPSWWIRALYGANAKVSNLINMLPAAQARHAGAVGQRYRRGIASGYLKSPPLWRVPAWGSSPAFIPANRPRTDAAGCGRSLAAMSTSYTFLPNAVLGTSLGLAAPCFGSTIALRRETLDEVGGFAAFADQLADDYEMGRAVRSKGYTLAIPAMGVGHTAAENSALELFRHELRWTRTIRLGEPGRPSGQLLSPMVSPSP